MKRYILKNGRKSVKPESVVVDLDDTVLLGTAEAWEKAFRQVFGNEFADSFHQEVKNRQASGGISLINYLKLCAQQNQQVLAEYMQKHEEFQKAFLVEAQKLLRVSEGFVVFISRLKQDGVKVILHTARSKETVYPDLFRFNLGQYFDNVYCKEDIISNGKYVYKSDPTALNYILQRENLNRTKTWVIGDSLENDVNPAAVNGCFPVAFGKQDKSVLSALDNQGLLFLHANHFTAVLDHYEQSKQAVITMSPKQLLNQIQRNAILQAIKEGKKIVATVGVFDLFHLGHAALFAQITCKAAEKLGVNPQEIFLIVGVQDQGRAVSDKSAIYETEQDRIKNVQNSGFCNLAVSRGGYPTDQFISQLSSEVSAVTGQAHPKVIDLWVAGADQSAETIQRAGLIIDSINRIAQPSRADIVRGFFKFPDRSTYRLSSSLLRGIISKSEPRASFTETLLAAREKVESANELTTDAASCLLRLYQKELIAEKSLQTFHVTVDDLREKCARPQARL